MTPTDEQERVFESRARRLLVLAYAGTGKTSTLEEYARRRRKTRFLYLCFNKAIQLAAKLRFPSNVKCVTTHGLAFPRFGVPYEHKIGEVKPYHLASEFGWTYYSATEVVDTLHAFLCSPDSIIVDQHAIAADVDKKRIGFAIDGARRVWESMTDTGTNTLPIPHDGYLKLFQQSRPRLPTDCLLLDEGQDTNPMVLDIFNRQTCAQVMVGDKYQGIYAFRGAVNAMEKFDADESLRLTASFRFGAGIGRLASELLGQWRGENVPLVGRGKTDTRWVVDIEQPHAVIARTNAGLFDAAVQSLDHPLGFGFCGGVNSYKFNLVLDGYRLFADQAGEIEDKVLKALGTWGHMVGYAEETDDKEFKALIRVVQTYNHDIPEYICRIKAEAKEMSLAGVTLTTAHKSKGLQWNQVRLMDDFGDLEMTPDVKTGKPEPPEEQEIHLFYVAATRAHTCLELNNKIRDWLRRDGPFDLYEEIASSVAYGMNEEPFNLVTVATPGANERLLAISAGDLPAFASDDDGVNNILAQLADAPGATGVLGWLLSSPRYSGPWLARVRESVRATGTVGDKDRHILCQLLGDLAARSC